MGYLKQLKSDFSEASMWLKTAVIVFGLPACAYVGGLLFQLVTSIGA
ncbi:hypothetical protein CHOED_069 [Vibrio phage CHOED]|nr:hypothetical protein CHOED_069 [Vibrio phage CHOED]AHK11929.1 putative membrane protein [Vibrio phage CHOED]